MNYEEIGKRAVELGYDGGGIWVAIKNGAWHRFWKRDFEALTGNSWPDFSYPETEGAALAWIAEKSRSCAATFYPTGDGFLSVILVGFLEGKPVYNGFVAKGASKTEAILAAIKSLGLRKKDNSPMCLNKRLLELGFLLGGCLWVNQKNRFSQYLSEPVDIWEVRAKNIVPDGSHPSTIGVATAWLRSFPKIGDSFHIAYLNHTKEWVPFLFDKKVLDDGPYFNSELEALVEFAEWANEGGLMK